MNYETIIRFFHGSHINWPLVRPTNLFEALCFGLAWVGLEMKVIGHVIILGIGYVLPLGVELFLPDDCEYETEEMTILGITFGMSVVMSWEDYLYCKVGRIVVSNDSSRLLRVVRPTSLFYAVLHKACDKQKYFQHSDLDMEEL